MDDALVVSGLERVHDRGGDPERLVDWKLLLSVDAVPQRLALYVGHDVEREAARLARVEQRNDVRMPQVGVVLISARKRSAPTTAASSGLSTLSATLRSCVRSSAR